MSPTQPSTVTPKREEVKAKDLQRIFGCSRNTAYSRLNGYRSALNLVKPRPLLISDLCQVEQGLTREVVAGYLV